MSVPTLGGGTGFDSAYKMAQEQVKAKSATVVFKTQVILHTPEKDFTYKDGLIMREMVIDRDYENNIGDYVEVRLSIPSGTFTYDIFDYADNLELTVRRIRQYNETATNAMSNKPVVDTERYKLVFLKDKNSELGNLKKHSKQDLNQRLPIVTTWQIVLRQVEALRVKTTAGSFDGYGVLPDNLMRAVMSTESNTITIEGKKPLDLIDIQKADCTDYVKSLTFMSYTRLIEIPDYLQQKSVGVYNAGLGCFIQKHYNRDLKTVYGFWMFSLYDPDKPSRVNTQEYTVFCPDTSTMSSALPAHFTQSGVRMTYLIAQKVTKIDDDRETGVMSGQSGFRVGDAVKMLSDAAFTISKEGPIFSKKKLSTELIYKLRPDGVQHSANHGNYANNLHLASEVLKRQSAFMSITFNNLDHDIVSPGKTAVIIYRGNAGKTNGLGEGTVVKTMNRRGLLLRAVYKYTIVNSNPVMDLNSNYVDMQNNAELRYCVGKPF